jgi:hypothetical protein
VKMEPIAPARRQSATKATAIAAFFASMAGFLLSNLKYLPNTIYDAGVAKPGQRRGT